FAPGSGVSGSEGSGSSVSEHRSSSDSALLKLDRIHDVGSGHAQGSRGSRGAAVDKRTSNPSSDEAGTLTSFTEHNLEMLQRFMAETETRAREQRAVLKAREGAVVERGRMQLVQLDAKIRALTQNGLREKAAQLENQRQVLKRRVHEERKEIKRLKEEVLIETRRERERLLKHHQNILRMRLKQEGVSGGRGAQRTASLGRVGPDGADREEAQGTSQPPAAQQVRARAPVTFAVGAHLSDSPPFPQTSPSISASAAAGSGAAGSGAASSPSPSSSLSRRLDFSDPSTEQPSLLKDDTLADVDELDQEGSPGQPLAPSPPSHTSSTLSITAPMVP
ncbi:unnamed protein product, partial [Cyprideis torosa]